MYVIGVKIDDFDYNFCENYDLSFIEDYFDDYDEYEISLKNFESSPYNVERKLKYDDSYPSVDEGENIDMYYKLVHFISTYFKTNLSFYTEPIDDRLNSSEPLYLGVITNDITDTNVQKIISEYDKKTFNKILKLLEFNKCKDKGAKKLKIYSINSFI